MKVAFDNRSIVGVRKMDDLENPFQLSIEDEHRQDDAPLYRATQEAPPGETPAEKYRRLKLREQELIQRQQELRASQDTTKLNWPPCFPFLLHLDYTEIPQAAKRCIEAAVAGVCIVLVQSLLNIFASGFVTGLKNYSRVKSVIFAIIFGLLSSYITVSVCWTKLYSGCVKHDVPFSFIVWQFVLIGWTIYLAVGFPNSGSVGVATFIDLIAKSTSVLAKVFAGFNMVALFAMLATQIVVLQQAQKYQKVSGVTPAMQERLAQGDTANL